MPRTSARTSRRRLLTPLAALAAAVSALAAQTLWMSGDAHAATTPVVDNGGTVLSHRDPSHTGALGVTFSFQAATQGGGPYTNQGNQIYNLPLYAAGTADSAHFWTNEVEELVSAGVDFVAVDTRGYIPGSTVPNEGGDPRALTGLVNAINQAGVADKLKIAAFDDTPASMTDKKNQVKHHAGGYSPPFDMGDTNGSGEGGYQYLWDNDLKSFFQAVPDSMLYKVNGQPLVYLWSDNAFAFSNQGNGNSARLLTYVRNQAKSTFNENPYFVVDQSWIKNDPAVSSVANGQDGWFGVPTPTYTNMSLNGQSFGATTPSFHFVTNSSNMVIDPQHGQTLVNNLHATVDNGDLLTLVEGFTDWPENCALWRTEDAPYATTQRDYPGQDLNILRRYSKTPFPTDFTVQAETADAVHDTTSGNQFGVYRGDDLDVQTTTDTHGGWNVGATATGEWEQWNEVPMQGTTDMKIRVASPNTGEQLRFVVDGVAGPTISVPDTGGWQNWQTIDAGTFQFKPGTYHAVQIQQVTGGYNLNWWQATRTDNPETVVDDSQLTYDANWHASSDRGLGDYDDDVHHSETVGAAASYTFTGTGIDYLSERNGDMGNVDVYLDNVLQANVNLKVSGARQSQQVVWSKTGLTSGTHTLRIVNKTGAVGMIDALRVHS